MGIFYGIFTSEADGKTHVDKNSYSENVLGMAHQHVELPSYENAEKEHRKELAMHLQGTGQNIDVDNFVNHPELYKGVY